MMLPSPQKKECVPFALCSRVRLVSIVRIMPNPCTTMVAATSTMPQVTSVTEVMYSGTGTLFMRRGFSRVHPQALRKVAMANVL
ncbi:MAG: hypothetical protein CAPSK01_004710 [Candidatus Accumulibacter vicinus]|uniref:Uncharacterized protein n=1 Tax=Candidatus Accumulibacter vicinus TaxID=2954382 RepID=A0A084XTS8_9PROT|nr:MAG: hypothetical protein CAPSK01_004710 [Candidatus Accumulibacter vicinus]